MSAQIVPLALSLSIVLAGPAAAGPPREKPAGPAAGAAEAGNAFAVDLYAKLAARKGNIFCSPHSVHVALAMALAGARGETAAEVAKVLRLAGDPTEAPDVFRALIEGINSGAKRRDEELYKLVTANALWGQAGYPFRKEYLDLVEAAYGGHLGEVDFAKAVEAARKTINDWVADRTAGKIAQLIPAGLLTPDTRLVLTNAIYMKSAWANPFQKEFTKEEPFRTAGGETPNVPLMRMTRNFAYLEGDGFQAAELPYRGGALSMVVLLPGTADGLPALEKKLTPEALAGWLAGLESRKLDVSLPRFKLEAKFNLSTALKSLGMTGAFAYGRADFSGIAGNKELFIGEVIHKAYVDVNEEGTEAAAATAVTMRAGARPKPEEPVVFKADHPFLFLIRHRPTGAVLFLGRLADPRW